jgi:hypothetical protein
MSRMTLTLFCAATGLSFIAAGAPPSVPKTLTGAVTVVTKGPQTAVLGRPDANAAACAFQFCMDLAPGAPKSDFSGRARVVYVPNPIQGLPPGVTISGPEPVASVLAVVPETGKAIVFLGRGEKNPLPAGDPALKNAVTVPVTVVRRLDWNAAAGPRRGTELTDCFVDAG